MRPGADERDDVIWRTKVPNAGPMGAALVAGQHDDWDVGGADLDERDAFLGFFEGGLRIIGTRRRRRLALVLPR